MLGLKNFMGNIGAHLKKGLMEWLFGALAGAGLQLPDTFDLKGIVSIVLQVLGLTYANFRARAVAIVGEPVVAALEKAAEVFKVIVTEGIPGLWRFIKEKLADLKSMVLDAIFDFIKEKVIIAGVTWVIGLLNPASAFFKACKAIYDIVMFFINRGSQILALVNAVIDSMAAIAKGSIGVAATLVENALAKAIPVAIGFLASLLGLGDISGTIKKTIEKAQAPVNKAIDWVINGAVKVVKAAGNLVKGLVGGKEKDEKPRRRAPEPAKAAKVDAKHAATDAVQHASGRWRADERCRRGGCRGGQARPSRLQVDPVVEAARTDSGLRHDAESRTGRTGRRARRPQADGIRKSPLSTRAHQATDHRRRVRVSLTPERAGLPDERRREELERPWPRHDEDTGLNSDEKLLAVLTFGSCGDDPARRRRAGHCADSRLVPASQPSKTPAKHGDQPSGGLVVEPEQDFTSSILAWNSQLLPSVSYDVSFTPSVRPSTGCGAGRCQGSAASQRIDIDVEGRAVCDICRPDLERFECQHFQATGEGPDRSRRSARTGAHAASRAASALERHPVDIRGPETPSASSPRCAAASCGRASSAST